MSDALFTIVLHGYDRPQVDALVAQAKAGQDVREGLRRVPVVLRGYDCTEVERYFDQQVG